MQISSLWDHEVQAIKDIRYMFDAYDRVLYQGATASGKTTIFCQIAKLYPDKRILIIGHTHELLTQISRQLADLGVRHAILSPEHKQEEHERVQVASVQTLVRRLDLFSGFDLIILDEAHHAVARMWRRVVKSLGRNALLLGVTATPRRLDNMGLDDIFEVLICGPQPNELIAKGILAKPRVYAPARDLDLKGIRKRKYDFDPKDLVTRLNKRAITGDAIAHYKRICPNARALVFCVNIQHAQDVAEQAQEHNITAECLHGELVAHERQEMIERFRSGTTKWLTSCIIAREGLDLPDMEAVIDLCPSDSLIRVVQGWGRFMRGSTGKRFGFLLDHAGNTTRHGLPDSHRNWDLAGDTAGDIIAIQRCSNPDCRLIVDDSYDECPECGTPLWIPLFPSTTLPYPVYVDGDLHLVGRDGEEEPWMALQRRLRCSEDMAKKILAGKDESETQAKRILRWARSKRKFWSGFSMNELVGMWYHNSAKKTDHHKNFQRGMAYLIRRNIIQTSQSSRNDRWYWFHPFIVNCNDDEDLLKNGIELRELAGARGYRLQDKVKLKDGRLGTVVRITSRLGVVYYGISLYKNGSARRYEWHKVQDFRFAPKNLGVMDFTPVGLTASVPLTAVSF